MSELTSQEKILVEGAVSLLKDLGHSECNSDNLFTNTTYSSWFLERLEENIVRYSKDHPIQEILQSLKDRIP